MRACPALASLHLGTHTTQHPTVTDCPGHRQEGTGCRPATDWHADVQYQELQRIIVPPPSLGTAG